MADLFISYAREDEARIRPLAHALEQGGWSVFWDQHIPTGQSWRSYIGQALIDARCVIVVWSRHSVASRWVIEEADEGQKRGILVPVLFDRIEPPIGFRGIQAADLTDWRPDKPSLRFDQLVRDIYALLTGASIPPVTKRAAEPEAATHRRISKLPRRQLKIPSWHLTHTLLAVSVVLVLGGLMLAMGLHTKLPWSSSVTNELIPDWRAIGGSWTGPDKNGMVHGKTAAFDGDALYLFKNAYTDFRFSAAAQALNREASLAVRMSDDGKNGYLVIFVPHGSKGGNPGLWLGKRVGGDHNRKGWLRSDPAVFKADYALGTWVRLTVEAQGPRISVFLNQDLVIDFEDKENPFTSGRLGFRCYGEPTAPCEANFTEFYLTH